MITNFLLIIGGALIGAYFALDAPGINKKSIAHNIVTFQKNQTIVIGVIMISIGIARIVFG